MKINRVGMATPLTTGIQNGGVAVMAAGSAVGQMDHSGPANKALGVNGSSPIRIFLFFHKAIRAELDGLHLAAMDLATNQNSDIKPLQERCHFLRSIYKHHCNAEDEVCSICTILHWIFICFSYSIFKLDYSDFISCMLPFCFS